MAMRWWFNVEKVDPPSEEPLPDNLVSEAAGYVMEEVDIPYYKLFGYYGTIVFYDTSPSYFIARQYIYDDRADTFILYTEYRLTLTDDAKKIVNALLNAPFFEYNVKHNIRDLRYDCLAVYPVYIPEPETGRNLQGQWDITICEEDEEEVRIYMATTIPFNCGPLQPLWERAVECWVDEIVVETKPEYVNLETIRNKLLKHQYLRLNIIPMYYI